MSFLVPKHDNSWADSFLSFCMTFEITSKLWGDADTTVTTHSLFRLLTLYSTSFTACSTSALVEYVFMSNSRMAPKLNVITPTCVWLLAYHTTISKFYAWTTIVWVLINTCSISFFWRNIAKQRSHLPPPPHGRQQGRAGGENAPSWNLEMMTSYVAPL